MDLAGKKKFLINCLFIATVLAIIYLGIRYALIWVMPFVIGFAIAMAVEPLSRWLWKKTKISRKIWGILSILLLVGIVGVVLWFAGAKLIGELGQILKQLPSIINTIPDALGGVSDKLAALLNKMPVGTTEQLKNLWASMSGEIKSAVTNFSGEAIKHLANSASVLPGIFFGLFIGIMSACFITIDYDNISLFFKRQFSEEHLQWVIEIKEFVLHTFAKMCKAYVIIVLVTFTLLSIGLTIKGVPYAITISMVIAPFELLPIFGTGAAFVPWILFLVVTGDWSTAITVVLLYFITALIRSVIEPRIVGKQTGIHPLLSLFTMYVGLQIFGFIGLFVLPPLVWIAKNMHETGKIKLWKD